MEFVKRLIVLFILVPNLAFAQNVNIRDNQNSKWIPWQGTSDGTGYIIDRYKYETTSFVLVNAFSTAAGGDANTDSPITGAGLAAFPSGALYGDKWATIKVTGGAAGHPWSVRFYGSRDGVTYTALMKRMPDYGAPSTIDWNFTADSLKVRGRNATVSSGLSFPLISSANHSVIHNYIVAVCGSDSAGLPTPWVFTVELDARKDY